MGLLYPFPVSVEESDFVKTEVDENQQLKSITVKSYGLPYIFWGYALASILMILLLLWAVHEPVTKLMKMGDDVDYLLGLSLLVFGYSLPLIILSFFFYEKRITRVKNQLVVSHRILGLPVFTEKFELLKDYHFEVQAHLDSPNVARLHKTEESKGFENKGYFILYLNLSNKKIFLDRHSRKADLEKLRNLLELIS